MRLIDNLLPDVEARGTTYPALPFDQYMQSFAYNGQQYGLQGSAAEYAPANFGGYVERIHRASPTVSSAAITRALVMSQLRFAWRDTLASDTPGRIHHTSTLDRLNKPAIGTRPSLLMSLALDDTYAGNSFTGWRNGQAFRLRPDWCTLVLGSDSGPVGDNNLPPSDARVVALVYEPEDNGRRGRPEAFMPGEFAHHMPEPDPLKHWLGASWVTSLVRQIALDEQVTTHQSKFFEHAATPSLVFIMDPAKTSEQVQDYADVVNERHAGAMNSFKNMFLGGGSDVKVVGAGLDKLALAEVQGGFENRVAQRSRVPATLLHIAEGNKGSALNSSTYGMTRREWADLWVTPTADGLCETFEAIAPPPSGAELSWQRDRVLFLQEDGKDAADIASTQASAMRQLVDGGFEPQSVIDAITTGNMGKLVHTGTLSVQLQPPGQGETE